MKVRFLLVLAFMLSGCASLNGPTPVTKNILFKKIEGGRDLLGDIYSPKTPGLHPGVVVVHGGGWIKRSGRMEEICKRLARNGFVAFNITYRLAPKTHYPESVSDISDGILFLRQHAAEYGVDANNIFGWGYSAGSNLLLLATIDGSMGVRALVTGGTPADLTAWPKSPLVKDFLGVPFAGNEKLWEKASPLHHVTTNSPPLFMYHGAWDDLVEVDQMWRMERAMTAQNRPIETYTADYLGHFSVYLLSRESVTRGIDFLKKNIEK